MSAIIDGDLPRKPRFELGFAETAAEVLETQQLRYRIFAGELGAQIDSGAEGVDRDRYDEYCRHLFVREMESGRIIACTRILTDDRAALAGGFYSAGEFDLDMINGLPGRVMEIGRTCVDAEYRSGAVIATLWQGIAAYVTNEGYDYLFGCASIGLEDGGVAAHAILDQIRGKYLAPASQHVRPYVTLPAADARATEKPKLPPLLKAYLSLGAKACGEPYWDQDFNCADVFMLLNVSDLHPRYARHFLGKGAEETAPLAAGHA
ncbi:GNAT family N-acetyltransferase [Solimonas sp. K1W22B-7]|uniref:GNAT family N-acetyltransferase n=1 Tax=Solimonas sp. K1W22B-7 TaxID=2303331 RepID=UPI000E330EC1|nr:GNAT family N-acyltransferase [Solimonas sp. K1W22B-7]AXQ30320.1 GNAT family N-acetyltransferase [Solimonas sp. K1W22B-7]